MRWRRNSICDWLFGSGIDGEFVAEIFKRELQARSELGGVGDGFRQIRKKRGHLQRRFQVAFAVAGEQAPGIGEHAVMAQAGEDIEDFALRGQRVANAIGGEQWKMQTAREFDGNLVAAFFFDGEVALQFDVNIVAAENCAKLFQTFSRAFSFRQCGAHGRAGLRRRR